jgi:hypothetical protein
MSLEIPAKLVDKARGFGECSYGANRVTLVLKDGSKVSRVTLAWGEEIVQIDGERVEEEKKLGFAMADIVDVLPCP